MIARAAQRLYLPVPPHPRRRDRDDLAVRHPVPGTDPAGPRDHRRRPVVPPRRTARRPPHILKPHRHRHTAGQILVPSPAGKLDDGDTAG
jgi:hypothetical protein